MSPFVEKVASDLLWSDGISAIWQIHLAASKAYGMGQHHAAERLLEIADAAEEICWRDCLRFEESWASK
jgi:hypothetical protein